MRPEGSIPFAIACSMACAESRVFDNGRFLSRPTRNVLGLGRNALKVTRGLLMGRPAEVSGKQEAQRQARFLFLKSSITRTSLGCGKLFLVSASGPV